MNHDPDPNEKYSKLFNNYKLAVERQLRTLNRKKLPTSVYAPINYVISLGGKRIRPVLTMLACEAVGGKAENAVYAATAIEILHNFTLVHDDVMDHADLRRGNPTVHKKWDENVAILAGDEMIAQAYKMLLKTNTPRLKNILEVYTEALIQVCEGQGFDKEFENKKRINFDNYFDMISKKTGRIIAASLEIGGIIGGGTKKQVAALKHYGEYLGKAFQIMDDLLDIVGTTKDFGKKIGGDIREGKKTYLLIKALENSSKEDKKLLLSISPEKKVGNSFIKRISKIYIKCGAVKGAKEEILRNSIKAKKAIRILPSSQAKSILLWLPDQLLERTA